MLFYWVHFVFVLRLPSQSNYDLIPLNLDSSSTCDYYVENNLFCTKVSNVWLMIGDFLFKSLRKYSCQVFVGIFVLLKIFEIRF